MIRMLKKKHPAFQPNFLKSMRFKITFGIILILSFILLILGNITITEQRNRMMSQMKDYGTETVGFIAQISKIPIQKYSIYQLEDYVAQLEKGQLISYCEIYDNSGSSLAHSTKKITKTSVHSDKDNVFVFTAAIKDGQALLGRVELGLNLTPVLARINQTSVYITIAFWIELIVIGFTVSYFIHKSLVSPILRLSKTTSEIATGKFITSNQAGRSDEIGVLAKTINTMSNSLQDSYHTLELKVIERTAALTAAKNASEKTTHNLKIVSSELQTLLDNSPVAILFVSSDRMIQRVNREFSKIYGYSHEEVIGSSTQILYQNEQEYREARKITYSVLRRDGYCQATLKMKKKDGSAIMCSLRGRATILDKKSEGVIWCIEDITSRLKMEEEILKIKKLESISVLAGGIAHDFNNILVAIIGNISLAERLVGNSPKVVELLQNSKNASLRAKDLTIKLLTFAKGGDPVRSIESLPEILKDSTSFVLSCSNVKCLYDIAEDLWPIPMDKGQINQVTQNLILNADQSMPDGGTIHITCKNKTLAENEMAGVNAGKYVCLEIADTGVGIGSDIIDNIFDPYFSTKEKSSDKGSGLGLSIVHSIITKHDGGIFVRSSQGKGTVFTLYLPATQVIAQKEEHEALLPAGKGTILLMDDEETIHMVAEEMLAYLGYETVHANDGEEAVEIYNEYVKMKQPVDLVIMDLTIPGGMGGDVAVKKILSIDHKAKVIVSSGYSDDPVLQNYRKAGFVNIISKPYQLLDLSRILAETLAL